MRPEKRQPYKIGDRKNDKKPDSKVPTSTPLVVFIVSLKVQGLLSHNVVQFEQLVRILHWLHFS